MNITRKLFWSQGSTESRLPPQHRTAADDISNWPKAPDKVLAKRLATATRKTPADLVHDLDKLRHIAREVPCDGEWDALRSNNVGHFLWCLEDDPV